MKRILPWQAKELKRQLDRKGKYTVYLTRSTDVFIPLRKRVEIARKHKADLFMSVHADSALNRKATGLSVYTLSETASDKEAAALAERENKADVISGLNLVEQSKEVSDVLISLAQRETRNRSSEFAKCLVDEMRKSVKLISDTHRFAGFARLKSARTCRPCCWRWAIFPTKTKNVFCVRKATAANWPFPPPKRSTAILKT